MRLYETTFIINPQADDSTLDQNVKSIVELINNNGGNVVRENRMGTRRLAYQILGLSQGYYANLVFEGTNELLPILERHFKLEEQYIRYLTVRFEGELTPEGGETTSGDEEDQEGKKDREDKSSHDEPEVKDASESDESVEAEAEPEELTETEPVAEEEPKRPADKSTDTPSVEQEEL